MSSERATASAGAIVLPELRGGSRAQVLAEIADGLHAALPALDTAALQGALAEREAVGSTAIGGGVALPHCRLFGLDQVCLAVARHAAGIDFGAADRAPVHLFLVVLSPAEAPSAHLRLLAELARRIRDPRRVEHALAAASAAELLDALELGEPPEAV